MAATGLRRITVSIRGIINCSSFVKHINVTLASDSFKLRGILLPQRTAVSQECITYLKYITLKTSHEFNPTKNSKMSLKEMKMLKFMEFFTS